jgi:PHD/YefM family antitoxin component YafN of YafNO toxin-antitoxin module
MIQSLRYITDPNGRQQAIMMSLKDWKSLEKKLRAAEQKEKMYKSLKEALAEVKQIRTGILKPKSIEKIIGEA